MNNFNYNSFFYPNYNLFNSNIDYRQIGLGGVKTPQNLVDIHGNINTERLNIIGNINYNQNNNTNYIKIIQQTNTGLLQDKELYNTSSEWVLENNELELILKNDEFNDEVYYYSNQELCMYSKSPCSNYKLENLNSKKIGSYSIYFLN